MNRIALAAALLAAPALLACGNSGIICTSNEVRCGQLCANLAVDPVHCGACGNACAAGFVCSPVPGGDGGIGECVCPLNLTACGQACADLATNIENCGTCGNACGTGQSCSAGACISGACPGGTANCGGGCVDTTNDRQNCGGCADAGGVVCPQGQACVNGTCESDLYAACYDTGDVFALDSQGGTVDPHSQKAPPTNPSGLAFNGHDELAVIDGTADELFTFDITSGFANTQPDAGGFIVGQGPVSMAISNQVAAVTNGTDNSLDVLDAVGPGWERRCDAGSGCTASVHFDANTSPEYAAFDGTTAIYVSLQGNTNVAAPTGNQLARVGLSDLMVQTVDLTPLDLQAPDAGTEPRPNGVAVSNGKVYVALANLNGYSPDGPGLVATLDILPDGGAPVFHTFADGGIEQPVAPDPVHCINAGALMLAGNTLYLACGPRFQATAPYGIEFPGAVAALDISQDPPAPLWTTPTACPADAGSGCSPGAPTRMALVGGKIYAGDVSNGRLFVLDATSGALLNGPANALDLCVVGDGGFQEISDVAARP